MPERIRLGEYELFSVSDGTYSIDGGAFFGVVPKSLWSRKKVPDENNLVRAGLNCLVARSGRRTVLIETGIGGKLDEKQARIYGVQRGRGLEADITAQGIDPAAIDLVINTHLHFDHCGGNTRRENGCVVPAYPRARYLVQRGEYEHACRRHERDRVSYIADNYEPLIDSGRMTLLDGDAEVAPGIRVAVFPGHTRHMQVVVIESGGQTCAFLSDLVPTTAHLNPAWVMAYDLFPLESIESKRHLLARAAAERWLCVFVHDAEQPIGYIRAGAEGRFELAGPV